MNLQRSAQKSPELGFRVSVVYLWIANDVPPPQVTATWGTACNTKIVRSLKARLNWLRSHWDRYQWRRKPNNLAVLTSQTMWSDITSRRKSIGPHMESNLASARGKGAQSIAPSREHRTSCGFRKDGTLFNFKEFCHSGAWPSDVYRVRLLLTDQLRVARAYCQIWPNWAKLNDVKAPTIGA